MKTVFFWQEKHYKCMTSQQQPTGQLQQCTLPSHSTASYTQWGPHAWGSAQIPSGDTRLGMETGPSPTDVERETWHPWVRRDNQIPAQRVWPPEMRGEIDHAGHRRNKKLCSERYMVPGAHDYDRVLGAPNIVVMLNALDFFIVPWALLCWSSTDWGSWIL